MFFDDYDFTGMLMMAKDYDQRKVERTERENFTLDTVMVYDRSWLYETAVRHRDFNNNNWIILDGCDTKDEAIKMHNTWLKFLEDNAFETLTDYYDNYTYTRS